MAADEGDESEPDQGPPSEERDTGSGFRIQEASLFFNYTAALDHDSLDLLRVAGRLLELGITKSAILSDGYLLYRSRQGDVKHNRLELSGRRWDSHRKVSLPDDLDPESIPDVLLGIEALHHEAQFLAAEGGLETPYLRFELPPVLLANEAGGTVPLSVMAKLHVDGILIVSFLLDGFPSDVGLKGFINDYVNLFKRYFDQMYIHPALQEHFVDATLPLAGIEEAAVGGRMLDVPPEFFEEMEEWKEKSRADFEQALSSTAQRVELPGGTSDLAPWLTASNPVAREASLDEVRRIYHVALARAISQAHPDKVPPHLGPVPDWRGRPNVILQRFTGQADTASETVRKVGPELGRILMRSADQKATVSEDALGPDLRGFEDWALHAHRAAILWTWAKRAGEPHSSWSDEDVPSVVMNHQARAEHIEYLSARFSRLQSRAATFRDPAEGHQLLVEMSLLERGVQEASQAGEVSEAIRHILEEEGTFRLNEAAMRTAEWMMESHRHRREQRRRVVEWSLTIVFGIVGAAGLGQLAVLPLLQAVPGLSGASWLGLLSFLIAGVIVAVPVGFIAWTMHERT